MVMSGRSVNLTRLFLDRLRPPKRLAGTHNFASNRQLPFLNQQKEKRKYVAGMELEPRSSSWLLVQTRYQKRYATRQKEYAFYESYNEILGAVGHRLGLAEFRWFT